MRALYSAGEDSRGEIAIAATKEEWIQVIEKSLWIPDAAIKDGDAFSKLVHWLINQGVYE